MQILITAIATAVAVAQTLSSSPKLTRSESVLVNAVFDGDTIDVSTYGRVRLLGIDAPETSHGLDTAAPFGREARDRLTSLVLHRWIRLEMEGKQLDIYNRHLAYVVTEDGQFVNALLVREGLARVSARLPLARLPELKRAESEAQAFRRGMWGIAPAVPPTGYTPPSIGRRSSTAPHKPSRAAKKKKKS
jgi:endonuclease YncB( thermonuclease family)